MMSSVIIFLLCAGLASPSDVDPDAAARHRKSKSDCSYATSPVSPVQHTYAEDGLQVSRISFSSCNKPELMNQVPNFWSDVRHVSRPELWMWTGDSMYADTTDMNVKREQYNKAREEPSYLEFGPVSKNHGIIPVMGTWDDHDFAYDNGGNEYPCPRESQMEWATHFNISRSQPQHPDSDVYRPGVYNSRMFLKPGSTEPGIHVIMLDGRSGRDPAVPDKFGACRGSETRMLSGDQWTWLEEELNKESEIKIIVSGIQVLPPTNQVTRDVRSFCAHDSYNTMDNTTHTFHDSISRVGEDERWVSVPAHTWENWAEIPREREKLLGMAQRTMNAGRAGLVMFVSGDVHWAELHAKRMPESEVWGDTRVLYEITASGVPQHWAGFYLNSNRLRDRTADDKGNGVFNKNCQFPFIYQGVQYDECSSVDNEDTPWCSTLVTTTAHHVSGHWGHCAPVTMELRQETFSNSTRTCAQSKYNICEARANYGYIHVDWENRKLKMGIRTPLEAEEMSHTIKY